VRGGIKDRHKPTMPYLIYTPKYERPYVLDDEYASFLHYFEAWGWRCEQLDPTDKHIHEANATECKLKRKALRQVWEDEYTRRRHEEEDKGKALSKEICDAQKQAKKDAGEYVKRSLKKKMSKLFSKKAKMAEKEPVRYKDGVYVNHLEKLQKEWFEEVNGRQRIKEDA